MLNDLWAFNLKTKDWTQLAAAGAYPSGRKGHICSVQTLDPLVLLIIHGGNSLQSYSNELHVLKLQTTKNSIASQWITNEFATIGPQASNREGHSFIQISNSLLLIGGCNYIESKCFGDIFNLTFNLKPKQIVWNNVDLLLNQQEKSLLVYVKNRIYVIGGHSIYNKQIKLAQVVDCGKCVHGSYRQSYCECEPGYTGYECELGCGLCVNGHCDGNVCRCYNGYSGPDCSVLAPVLMQKPCVHNCRSRGSCSGGVCNCLPEYFGESCQYRHCTSTCGEEESRGVCNHDTGACDCQNTYGGDKCQYSCPYGCPEGFACINDYHCSCEDCPLSSTNCNEHGTLIGDTCDCMPQYCGKYCENKCPDCNGHGDYKGNCCVCYSGYYGPDCEKMCSNRCSGNGVCSDGLCQCSTGWEGPDCSQNFSCPGCKHGICVHGQCQCYPGYTGLDCGILACPSNCTVLSSKYEIYEDKVSTYDSLEDIPLSQINKHIVEILSTAGYCNLNAKKCECYTGYQGADCSESTNCQNNCSGQGKCINGMCQCDVGYTGDACELQECPNGCNGHGDCINEKCVCSKAWGGNDCSQCLCMHGQCAGTQCVCDPGWSGVKCEVKGCGNCFNGVCKANKCVCQEGFTGEDCGFCESFLGCSGCKADEDCKTGTCRLGKCLCDSYHTGKFCEILLCSGHGIMHNSGCVCEDDYIGINCSVALTCPNSCTGRGVCHAGECYCDPDYEGGDCGVKKTCPDNCNKNGICKYGQCICSPGYQGVSCLPLKSQKKCEDYCKGFCFAGKCYLTENKEVSFIETNSCPLSCSNRGKCIGNACYCDQDWTGEACEIHVLQDNSKFCMNSGLECSGNGLCSNGKCYCNTGYVGNYCEENSECLGCTGPHQVCRSHKCECKEGWSGSQCSIETNCVDIQCGKYGLCSNGKCLCQAGYSSSGSQPCSAELFSLIIIAVCVSLFYAGFIALMAKFCRYK
jgi:EGF-like domain/Tenascin EGF domain